MTRASSGGMTGPVVGFRVTGRQRRDAAAADTGRTARDPRRRGGDAGKSPLGRETFRQEPTKEVHSWGQMARNRRLSLTSIRLNALVLLVVGLVWWGLSRIIHVPRWLMIVIVAVTAFSFIFDIVNVLCINAEIRRRVGPSVRRRRQQP